MLKDSKNVWELLTMACDRANLNLSEVVSDYIMKKRDEILRQHPFAITRYADGRWKTYIPDESKPSGRRQIARKSREELENDIFNHYKRTTSDDGMLSKNSTMQKLFEVWIIWKRDDYGAEDKTLTEYRNDWKRFEKTAGLSKAKIESINKKFLNQFFLDITRGHAITKRRLTNIKSILNGLFKFAIDKDIISINPASMIDIKDYVSRCKPENENKDNYTIEERRAILDYLEGSNDIYDLAIALDFHLSVRIGELIAIHKEDIENNLIYIHRSVRRHQNLKDDLTTGPVIYTVEDRTKGNLVTGLRHIPLSKEAVRIVNHILEVNPDGKYLLSRNGKILIGDTFNERLKKICRELKIHYRSSHQIRFTVATILHESGVPVNQISMLLGHSETRTTFHYLRQRKPDSTTIEIMESALNK